MPVFSVLSFKDSKFFVFPLTKYLPFTYSMIFPTFLSFTVSISLNNFFCKFGLSMAEELLILFHSNFSRPVLGGFLVNI